MPPELKDSLQQKAIKLWKIALAQRQATETTTTMADLTTTTKNAAMAALLSGIDGNSVVDFSAPTTTTTTE